MEAGPKLAISAHRNKRPLETEARHERNTYEATGPACLSFLMLVYSLDHFLSVLEDTEMKPDVPSHAWESISSWPEYTPTNSSCSTGTFGIETDSRPHDSHAGPTKR